MSQPRAATYALALTPADPALPTVLVRLELDAGRAQIAELSVWPGSAGTPLPAELADIDMPLLIRHAVMMSTGRLPAGMEGLSPAVAQTSPGSTSDTRRDDADAGGTSAPVSQRSVTAHPPAKATRSRRSRTPAAGPGIEGMPSDLPKLYWRLGSVAKLAEHYDVPRQIARDWIKSLRTAGALPDPWSTPRHELK